MGLLAFEHIIGSTSIPLADPEEKGLDGQQTDSIPFSHSGLRNPKKFFLTNAVVHKQCRNYILRCRIDTLNMDYF